MKQATALPPGTLDVVVKVGQLTGNTLPQAVETTHELVFMVDAIAAWMGFLGPRVNLGGACS